MILLNETYDPICDGLINFFFWQMPMLENWLGCGVITHVLSSPHLAVTLTLGFFPSLHFKLAFPFFFCHFAPRIIIGFVKRHSALRFFFAFRDKNSNWPRLSRANCLSGERSRPRASFRTLVGAPVFSLAMAQF